MRYFTFHHGSAWFQIRVPARLRSRYGDIVRINLQTQDHALARQLSLRLAAEWLTRFSLNLAGEEFIPSDSDSPEMMRDAASESMPSGERMTKAFEYWRDLTPGRPQRTVIEFGATADSFDAHIGKPLAKLTRVDCAAYRDTLLKEGLAPATVRKRLGFIRAMLQTQVDAGRLPTNAASGLRVPRPRVSPVSRTEFGQEHLQRLFSSPVYTSRFRPRGGGGEACAWLPVLGLATGARLEELSQLRVRDVEAGPGGSLVLRIQDDGVQTRVKTAGSRRVVPLHPDVVACGFADYLELRRDAGDEWLWPALVPDTLGNRGGQFSKWFGRYLRSPQGCGIEDRRIVFHSLRHSFKTLCRLVMPEELHDRLTGHAASVGRSYGSVPLETLVEAVSRIRLPIALPRISAR